MKNAKKIIALALALIMLFAFAACTGASNNETTAPSSTESTTEYNGEKIKIAARQWYSNNTKGYRDYRSRESISKSFNEIAILCMS